MMDLPSVRELVDIVREFIEQHAMPELDGRSAFHARVAANVLGIVSRQLEQSARAERNEIAGLGALLQKDGELIELNRELCRRIRSGAIAWNDPALTQHLISTTLVKVAIDQPNYSGYVHSAHRPVG